MAVPYLGDGHTFQAVGAYIWSANLIVDRWIPGPYPRNFAARMALGSSRRGFEENPHGSHLGPEGVYRLLGDVTAPAPSGDADFERVPDSVTIPQLYNVYKVVVGNDAVHDHGSLSDALEAKLGVADVHGQAFEGRQGDVEEATKDIAVLLGRESDIHV